MMGRHYSRSLARWPALSLAVPILAVLLALAGCKPAAGPLPMVSEAAAAGASAASQPWRKAGPPKKYNLGIAGYNYTNRYIDSFWVEGSWGGNLDVSGPGTIGGGTCCVAWSDATRLPTTVKVRWVSGGCMRQVTNSYGESRSVPQHYFTEREVPLKGPLPPEPNYIEVHFYPDGHVEAAITASPSEARLKLSPDRAVDPYPEACKNTP
jgi:hypothetical protein